MARHVLVYHWSVLGIGACRTRLVRGMVGISASDCGWRYVGRFSA